MLHRLSVLPDWLETSYTPTYGLLVVTGSVILCCLAQNCWALAQLREEQLRDGSSSTCTPTAEGVCLHGSRMQQVAATVALGGVLLVIASVTLSGAFNEWTRSVQSIG